MKNRSIFWFVLLCLFSCEYNVEEGLPLPPCDTEPVVYEINWEMNTSGQLASVHIKPGDTVRWIWTEDGMPHDVNSIDPNAPNDFGSPIIMDLGYVYEYTFNEEVTFEYRCSVHPNTMFGTITVTACVEE